LRAMPALDGAILVAMSGYGSDEDRAEARDAGFDEYMVKPINLDVLRERLRNILLPPPPCNRTSPP